MLLTSAISSFAMNPLRRQQENIAFIRDNDCNSIALTLSGATPTAHAQAPGSCPLHTSENKNIQILSRTKSCYGLRMAVPGTLHCLPTHLDCSEVWKKILWHIFMS